LLAAGILLLTTARCGTAPPLDLEAEVAALREADARAQQSVVEKDVDAVASWVAEGATNYAPNAPAAMGQEGFQRSFEGAFALPGFAINYAEPTKVVVSSSGDLGYTVVPAEITINNAEGNPTTVQSRYLAVWKKEPDGTWKVIENMWNFAEPFPPSD
jgi:ketosteroid isomerase-like protein